MEQTKPKPMWTDELPKSIFFFSFFFPLLQVKDLWQKASIMKVSPYPLPSSHWRNNLELHSIKNHKSYFFPLRQFGIVSRNSTISSTILEDYKRNPNPIQATKLLYECNNIQTAFNIYNMG